MIPLDLNFKKQEIDYPNSKWISNWGIDKSNASNIYQLIRQQKPEVVIETGTFEAQGTYVIAKAMHENNNNGRIYTIDYDGDPTSNLEEEKWLALKALRDVNLKKINKDFPNCQVIFINGDSRNVLPQIFGKYGETKCDLFYQDSMHFFDGIKSEFDIIYSKLCQHSVIIFDDLKLKGVKTFKDWFIKNYSKEFNYYIDNNGHKQLIVQKI